MKKLISKLRSRLQAVLSCQIPFRYLNSVYFPHPVGIVIGSEVVIGKNVTIYQNVSVGRLTQQRYDAGGRNYPVIKDNVFIYAGAVLAGGITIGPNAVIGANAVVTRSVPENSLVYGYNQIKPLDKDDQLLKDLFKGKVI